MQPFRFLYVFLLKVWPCWYGTLKKMYNSSPVSMVLKNVNLSPNTPLLPSLFIYYLSLHWDYYEIYLFILNFLFLILFYEKIHLDLLECFNVLNCHFFHFQKKREYCVNPKVCNLWHNSSVRYMRTCQECPANYPWTGNTGISNSLADEIKN